MSEKPTRIVHMAGRGGGKQYRMIQQALGTINKLTVERDEANARAAELARKLDAAVAGKEALLSPYRDAAIARAEKAEAERDAAVYDNAAILQAYRLTMEALDDDKKGFDSQDELDALEVIDRAHPGRALLEEVEKMREQVADLTRERDSAFAALRENCIHMDSCVIQGHDDLTMEDCDCGVYLDPDDETPSVDATEPKP